jgi:hypothetical protein
MLPPLVMSGRHATASDLSEYAEIWSATLQHSPLYQTLTRCAAVSIRLQAAP